MEGCLPAASIQCCTKKREAIEGEEGAERSWRDKAVKCFGPRSGGLKRER